MRLFRHSMLLIAAISFVSPAAMAAPLTAIENGLVAHKALYDIKLIATHSGSQIINISGQMEYEWKPSCDAWVTNHKFKLSYEYADSPGMRITSDFTTYESKDGKSIDFTSRRKRDGEMYQEVRGHANLKEDLSGEAVYTIPEGIKYDLAKGSFFPMGHTMELIRRAQAGEKFFTADVFDGSDEDGPIQISSFIGKDPGTDKVYAGNPKINMSLLKDKAYSVRMAVFPLKDQEAESDYEMSMVFHENGIISDMVIDYDDFSVKQKLISLESIPADSCTAESKPFPKS